VLDAYNTDTDFQRTLNDPRIAKAQVIIGPMRTSQVSLLAQRTAASRQIVLSPESASPDLARQHPGFIQMNPSLRAHCEAILQQVRGTYPADQVVLVGKQKEAERFAFFQQKNTAMGGARLKEVTVPDAATNFDAVDLKSHIRTGKTTVFILPSWAGQDFIVSFFTRLKAAKGSNRVEVYGMPQWRNYDALDADLLQALNVHISAATYTDHKKTTVRDFGRLFYEQYGTIPDDDAFKGYDITLFAGKMLRKYGLSFPEALNRERFTGLGSVFQIVPYRSTGGDQFATPDYWENTAVHILQFKTYGFETK
jgi:ABC-type branched-subunit amino acid transport system substrate-binding protein